MSASGPGQEHVAESFQSGKVFAILHKDDPARPHLASLRFDSADDYSYLFIHGGQEVSRFENLKVGTHEIPASVVGQLLANEYGSRLNGLKIRLCSCYGNLLRPGESQTAAQALGALLPQVILEAYQGLVRIDPNTVPPQISLGDSVTWDPMVGPYIVGPPGLWEPVRP
jgi:hypothetical protein